MRTAFIPCAIVAVASMFAFTGSVVAQNVSYAGTLTQSGQPVNNGFVIAGTFKPSFDPQNYNYVYGIDSFGNMDTPRYAQAVSDGNFIPIGLGTLSSFGGTFMGSGVNGAGVGRQVWLFAFPQANPDMGMAAVLATSPNWITGASDLTISASDATIFKFGQKFGSALEFTGLPLPEPTSAALAAFAFIATSRIRRRRSAPVQST